MGTDSAVGIDNDLSSGQPGVAVGSADNETPGRIDVILHFPLEIFCGNDFLHDFLHEFFEFFPLHLRRMLVRDNNCLDGNGFAVYIAHGNLTLGVRAQECVFLRLGLAETRKLLHDLVRINNRGGHQFLRLVAGIAEHHPLISGALLLVEPLSD